MRGTGGTCCATTQRCRFYLAPCAPHCNSTRRYFCVLRLCLYYRATHCRPGGIQGFAQPMAHPSLPCIHTHALSTLACCGHVYCHCATTTCLATCAACAGITTSLPARTTWTSSTRPLSPFHRCCILPSRLLLAWLTGSRSPLLLSSLACHTALGLLMHPAATFLSTCCIQICCWFSGENMSGFQTHCLALVLLCRFTALLSSVTRLLLHPLLDLLGLLRSSLFNPPYLSYANSSSAPTRLS